MAPYKRPTSERSLIERAPLLTRGLIRHLRCVSYRVHEFTAIASANTTACEVFSKLPLPLEEGWGEGIADRD